MIYLVKYKNGVARSCYATEDRELSDIMVEYGWTIVSQNEYMRVLTEGYK